MNEYVVPEDKLEELAKHLADTIACDKMNGGPTSPPGKTLRKDKTFEECLDEGMSFKEANEAMKTKFVEVNVPNQYENDWDTMVNLQREEWNRLFGLTDYKRKR